MVQGEGALRCSGMHQSTLLSLLPAQWHTSQNYNCHHAALSVVLLLSGTWGQWYPEGCARSHRGLPRTRIADGVRCRPPYTVKHFRTRELRSAGRRYLTTWCASNTGLCFCNTGRVFAFLRTPRRRGFKASSSFGTLVAKTSRPSFDPWRNQCSVFLPRQVS